MVSSPMTALLAQMATKGAAWVVRPVGEVTEPDPADVDAARRAVEEVGAELWATTDEADFLDCLSDMLEREAPPSFWPLLAHWTLVVSPELPARRVHLVLGRVMAVFGIDAYEPFMKAVRLTELTVRLAAWGIAAEAVAEVTSEVPLSFFDPAFPPSLRKGLIGGQKATFCTMAVIAAAIKGEVVPEAKGRLVLSTWIAGQRALAQALGGLVNDLELDNWAMGLGVPKGLSTEALVREGIEVDAHLGTLLGAHPA